LFYLQRISLKNADGLNANQEPINCTVDDTKHQYQNSSKTNEKRTNSNLIANQLNMKIQRLMNDREQYGKNQFSTNTNSSGTVNADKPQAMNENRANMNWRLNQDNSQRGLGRLPINEPSSTKTNSSGTVNADKPQAMNDIRANINWRLNQENGRRGLNRLPINEPSSTNTNSSGTVNADKPQAMNENRANINWRLNQENGWRGLKRLPINEPSSTDIISRGCVNTDKPPAKNQNSENLNCQRLIKFSEQEIKKRLKALDAQRVQNYNLAVGNRQQQNPEITKRITILYNSDIHMNFVQQYLKLYSIGIDLGSEAVVRYYWSLICVHMVECILSKICDVQRLSEKSPENNMVYKNSRLSKRILIYGLYIENFEDSSYIEMALLDYSKKKVLSISFSNILCNIYSNADNMEINMDFHDITNSFPAFYHYLEKEMNNILKRYLIRIEQYYIMMPIQEIIIVDQQADISDIDLQLNRLKVIPSRHTISYEISSNDIDFLTNYLKKWDPLLNSIEKQQEIKIVMINLFRDFLLDVLRKIFVLKLDDNFYCIQEDMVNMDYSFAYSLTGRYNTIDLRGKQKTGYNSNGKYYKEVKITRALLGQENPALFVVPLRAIINFHYDKKSLSLMQIDCYNLNSLKKCDPFKYFCTELKTRINNLFHDFLERCGQNYIIHGEN
jgi:hypothetical protein